MQGYQDQVYRAPGVSVETTDAIFAVHFTEVTDSLCDEDQEEYCVQENEREEVLVIAITEAVVDEWTMMVE